METQIQNKLKALFGKVIEPKYVMDAYYSDNLINKFLKCYDSDILKTLPVLTELLVDTVKKSQGAHDSVKVFLTRMVAVALQNELSCLVMFCKPGGEENGFDIFSEINSLSLSPSLTVAYIDVALAMIKHNSGVMTILKNGIWKQILSFTSNTKTVFISRKVYAFASKFVWKLNDMSDEQNLRLVLTNILKPIHDIDFISLNSVKSEAEEEMLKSVEPMVHILMAIVSEKDRIATPSLVIQILVNEYKFCTFAFVMCDRIRQEETVSMLLKLLFWLIIGKVMDDADKKDSSENIIEISVIFYNSVNFLIQRRAPLLVLDYCYSCYDIWSLVHSKTACDGNKKVPKADMQKSILLLCIVTPLIYIFKIKKMATDTVLDEYIKKVVNSSCEHTVKACYAFRDLIEEMDTVSITLQSVKRLTHLRRNLTDEEANLVFQALFHILKQYLPLDESGEFKIEEDLQDSEENVVVMTYVMDALQQIVKYHDISWHESLEVLCLYNLVYGILKRPNLSCKFIVTSLNVISLTIKKFLPPNLSLLVESKPGSDMYELGKLIYTKMHDMNWEVRDSALELLYICTEIAFIKFQPFQKQLIENNLINVAATIALHDHESYVQASALKCLASATKITVVWEKLTQEYPDIQNKLIIILRNNDEGIVRKEACFVLCEIYQNIKTTSEFKCILYEHMVSSALADFHWEVQLVALRFWKIVIQQLLNDQGMLDGSFPSVTFSRETRKIVTLNETEIQRRLMKVLNELSSIGCLTVLTKHLYEDLEVDIMDSALNISLDLIDILNKNNLTNTLNSSHSNFKVEDIVCKKLTDSDLMEGVEETTKVIPQQEKVIEGILNADDINLLANIYSSHLNINYKGPPETCNPKIKVLEHATPQLFVNFISCKDHKEIIKQKRIWKEGIRSLSSLLDDILGIYAMEGEVNSADCY